MAVNIWLIQMSLRIVVILLVLTVSACSSGADNRKHYWEQRFAQELPIGTPEEQVEEFFSKIGVEHGFDEKTHTYFAVERDVSGGFFVSYGVELQCKLAISKVLERCIATVYGDGP